MKKEASAPFFRFSILQSYAFGKCDIHKTIQHKTDWYLGAAGKEFLPRRQILSTNDLPWQHSISGESAGPLLYSRGRIQDTHTGAWHTGPHQHTLCHITTLSIMENYTSTRYSTVLLKMWNYLIPELCHDSFECICKALVGPWSCSIRHTIEKCFLLDNYRWYLPISDCFLPFDPLWIQAWSLFRGKLAIVETWVLTVTRIRFSMIINQFI